MLLCCNLQPLHPRPLMLAAGLWENDHELAVELVLAGADITTPLQGCVDYVEGMSYPLEDPTDLLSWTIDKIRSCGILTSFCRLLIKANVPVRKSHVDRAQYWAQRVVRHTASRPGQRQAPPRRQEDTGPDFVDTIPDPNYEVQKMVEDAFNTPSSLLATCRRHIRNELFQMNGCRDVRRTISGMTILPEVVRSYLAMESLTDECRLFSVSDQAAIQSQTELNGHELRALLGLTWNCRSVYVKNTHLHITLIRYLYLQYC